MRKFGWALATFAIMVVARVAQGAPPCEWEVNKADTTAVTLTEGDVAVVAVTVPVRGQMRTPAGWESQFKAQDACPGFPVGCGTWVATRTVTLANAPGQQSDNGNATFTVENAGCTNNARTFNLTVQAKPVPIAPPPPPDPNEAKWTIDEKSEAMARREAAMDFGIGYAWIPNLSTMTRMAHGVELQANGRIGRHASLGGGLSWLTYGQPIWSDLRPTTMQTTVNQVSAQFQAAGVITAGQWLEWSLGGFFKLSGKHHPQEYIGGGRYVSEDTRFVPSIGPWTKLALYPSTVFGFYGQFALAVDLTPSPTDAGTENVPESRAQSPDSVVHVWPTIGTGIVVRLP